MKKNDGILILIFTFLMIHIFHKINIVVQLIKSFVCSTQQFYIFFITVYKNLFYHLIRRILHFIFVQLNKKNSVLRK